MGNTPWTSMTVTLGVGVGVGVATLAASSASSVLFPTQFFKAPLPRNFSSKNFLEHP